MNRAQILTLVAANGLPADAIARMSDAIAAAGGTVTAQVVIDSACAVDLVVRGLAGRRLRSTAEAAAPDFDTIVQPAGGTRRKALLVADMDSTMIGQECIDELADFAGRKAEIAAITEAAMRGELDFTAALDARVAALKGLDARAIHQCLEERIHLTPGARPLVATMRAHGATTVLVSGGFTAFTESIAARIGFDRQFANRLDIVDGYLAGTVSRPIIDAEAKRQTLVSEREAARLSPDAVLAIGDGANDIPMLREAGLGIAYHAKPKATEAADATIRHGDLTTLLWAQGIQQRDWIID